MNHQRRIIPSPCGHWELIIWPGGRKEIRRTTEGRQAAREGRVVVSGDEALRMIVERLREEQA